MADRFLDGFALLGSDERGAITWTGGAVESLCGRGPESLRGRALGEVIREVVGAEAGAAFEEALASGAGFRLTGETLVVEAAPIAGAAGPQGWCLTLRAALAPVDAAALAESEERYRRLVEACPEPIVVHAGGRIRFANPAALALLGAGSAAEVLDRPMMDFVHPEFRAVVAERVRKMLETGGPAMLLEERIVRPDGSVLEVEIAGAAVCFQGELAIQLVGRDVTERRRAEAERRRLEEQVREARRRESLLRLAEGVARRLSELSAALLETVDASLVRGGRAERIDAAAIRRVGLRMAALTEQLLGFVGKRGNAGAPVNLSSLVLELSEGLETEIGGVATLSYDLPVELPDVRVDAVQMRRVVRGLVRNAADALGPAGGSILVRALAVEADGALLARVQPPGVLRPGPCVALEVRDRGCGMDEATSAHLGEPFFSTKAPDRGLGLAEVVGLVGAQGGGLRWDSRPGRGTTVTLLFPALPAVRPTAPAPSRSVRRRR